MKTTLQLGGSDWFMRHLYELLIGKELLIQFEIASDDEKQQPIRAIVKPMISTLKSVYCNVICRNNKLINMKGLEILFTDKIDICRKVDDIILFKLEWEGY